MDAPPNGDSNQDPRLRYHISPRDAYRGDVGRPDGSRRGLGQLDLVYKVCCWHRLTLSCNPLVQDECIASGDRDGNALPDAAQDVGLHLQSFVHPCAGCCFTHEGLHRVHAPRHLCGCDFIQKLSKE